MRCLTLRQVAKETGIRYEFLLEAVRSGALRAFVPPGMVKKHFVRDVEVERWLESMEQESNGK